ncbi:hypothetical protein [Spongiactinospora sp. 9N601]|uniref:hypothetical protein n=1 Tax=Spongiactinospora sp. 9N601 TaxID=3375149 RepID=UPI0037882ACF
MVTDTATAATAAHATDAAQMSAAPVEDRQRRQVALCHHADGHTVELWTLLDHDALFGVDFTNPEEEVSNP